jgi:hypothetical protein
LNRMGIAVGATAKIASCALSCCGPMAVQRC